MTSNKKVKTGLVWVDYVLTILLFSPLVLALVWGEDFDTVGYIMVFLVGCSPPLVYFDSRRLGASKKSAIGWAIGSLLFWIFLVPKYIFSGRKELKDELEAQRIKEEMIICPVIFGISRMS